MTHPARKIFETLKRDDRGAILTFGAFLAPFLVAAVYYLVATANTMMQREGLQAAADASAFAPSVVSARGMNTIAVMNILMMCIMSIVIPVRAMHQGYVQVASMGCPWYNPCQCARVADAKRVLIQLTPMMLKMEQRASNLLNALDDAQQSIAEHTGQAGVMAARMSALRTSAFLEADGHPEVYGASLSKEGGRMGLPVEDDNFREVCSRTRPFNQEIALRLASQTLHSMGTCQSGPWAFGFAQPNLLMPENPFVCREQGSGPHPKKVFSEASNGSDYMQYWGRVQGRSFDSPRSGVEVGGGKAKGSDPARELDVGFSQSEFYYDCSGSWSSCNKSSNALWDTRWTARLRRVHAPTISFQGDGIVKNELTSGDHWASVRSEWLAQRRDFTTGGHPHTEEAAMLTNDTEGPLQ